MKPTYIHIGYPKTGTSFLQFEVFPKIKEIKYWHVGGFPKNDEKKMRKLLDKIRNINEILNIKQTKQEMEQLLDKTKPNLISFESLIGEIFDPNYHDMDIIADRLHAVFDNPKIILCIRNKDTMIRSLYSQYIKEGGILEKEDFIRKCCLDMRLNYDRYIKYLKSLFGEICILRFEYFKKDVKQFVKDLCSFMNVETPEFENKRYNVSLNQKQLEMLRLINHAFKTKLNPKGLPPQRLWELTTLPKKIIISRPIRKLTEEK